MKKLIFILSLLLMVSCGGKHDGVVVQGKDGKVYILKHHIGATYFIEEADFSDLELDIYKPEEE